MLCDLHAYPTIPARDLARARNFYEQVLGFEASDVTPNGVFYDARGSAVFLYPSEFAGTNQATAVAFDTEDLATLVRELRGKGVTFENYDFGEYKTTDGMMSIPDGKAAWFKDSEGNIVGLFQASRVHSWPRDASLQRQGA